MIHLMILFVRWFPVNNKAILEGLLFVVGEEGLTLDQIEDVLEIDEEVAYIVKEIFELAYSFLCHYKVQV